MSESRESERLDWREVNSVVALDLASKAFPNDDGLRIGSDYNVSFMEGNNTWMLSNGVLSYALGTIEAVRDFKRDVEATSWNVDSEVIDEGRDFMAIQYSNGRGR